MKENTLIHIRDIAGVELLATREDIITLNGKVDNLGREMTHHILEVKGLLAETKYDIVKWSFIFWASQMIAMFGFLKFFA